MQQPNNKIEAVNTLANCSLGCGCLMLLIPVLLAIIGVALR